MATSAVWPGPAKPAVLRTSATALPENTFSSGVCAMATSCSDHVTRSVEVACPQDIGPQTLPSGLFWKNRW